MLHTALLLVCAVAVYAGTFKVPFQFDDGINIVENPIIKDFGYFLEPSRAKDSELYDIFRSRYLGYLTLALNYKIGGLDTTGYHAFNLAVHIAASLLVYWLVLLLLMTPRLRGSLIADEGRAPQVALYSALIFAVHPVQTQAVTYIVQRFASLAAMLYLLSLTAYLGFRLARLSGRGRALYAVSVLGAVIGMKVKETTLTLPAMIVLAEVMFFDGPLKKRLAPLIPFVLTAAIIPLSLMGASVQAGDILGDASSVMRMDTDMGRLDYLFTEFSVVCTYIRLLFLPIGQNIDYDYPIYRSFFDSRVIASFAFIVFLIALGALLVRRSRGEAGLRLAGFGILWFFITLSVESGLVPIADVIFEHRLYLPSVGAVIAVTSGAYLTLGGRPKAAVALRASLWAAIMAFALATVARNSVWQSGISLWSDAAKKSPLKARVFYNLHVAYWNSGRAALAEEALKKTISLSPGYNRAKYFLAETFFMRGRYKEAALVLESIMAEYKKTLAGRDKGDYVKSGVEKFVSRWQLHYRLGVTYYNLGDYGKALSEYKKALSMEPAEKSVINQMALAQYALGNYPEAERAWSEILAKDPDYGLAHESLGMYYLEKADDRKKAHHHLKETIRLYPDHPERQWLEKTVKELQAGTHR